MKRVAILNLKGGVGKTTTAVSLAYILANKYRMHTLVVDCDMQGNASKALGQYTEEGNGTHTIMLNQADPEDCIRNTVHTETRAFSSCSLDIIPANMYLMHANMQIAQDEEGEQLHRLDNALRKIEDCYDIAIMDCALGLDMTVLNALVASDIVIAPTPFGGYEIDGLFQLREQLEDLKTIKPDLRLKALFTMKQGNKTNEEFERWIKKKAGVDTYQTSVRRSVVVQKASVEGVPLPEYSKLSTATKDYMAVAEELMKDLK